MGLQLGTPGNRANFGIFCKPAGRASFGYWCYVDDILRGGSQNPPTKSLPYSGDRLWKDQLTEKELDKFELTEKQKRILREDEEVLWILKMFLRCQ